MCSVSPSPPVLVVACGNPWAGDDALGAQVSKAMRASPLPAGVELLDIGANPADLADHVDGRAALIIVDAVVAPGRPAGELIDLPWSEAAPAVSLGSGQASTHALGLAGQLALLAQLGLLPPVVRVIGLTIAHVRLGRRPSLAVRRRLPALFERVRAVATQVSASAVERRDR